MIYSLFLDVPSKEDQRPGRGGQMRLVLVMRCSFGYLAPARGGTSTSSRVMVTGQLPSSFSLCTEIIRWQQINFSRFMKELRSWSRFAEYLNYTLSAQTRAAATVRWNETYTFSSFHHSSLTCQILKYLHNYTEVDIVVCPVCSGVVQNIIPEYSVCMRCVLVVAGYRVYDHDRSVIRSTVATR